MFVVGLHVAKDWKKEHNPIRKWVEERVTDGKPVGEYIDYKLQNENPVKDFIKEKTQKGALAVNKIGLDKSTGEICEAVDGYEVLLAKIEGKTVTKTSNEQCDSITKLEKATANIVASLEACNTEVLKQSVTELALMSQGMSLLQQQMTTHMNRTFNRLYRLNNVEDGGKLIYLSNKLDEHVANFEVFNDLYVSSAKEQAREKCGINI